MFERTKRVWKGTVQAQNGQPVDVEVETYWSPDFEGVKEMVKEALCAKAYLDSKRNTRFVPIGEPELVS